MKQQISTLMDGELCGEEAELLLGKIKHHPEARREWMAYHLIGDALRQPDYVSGDISASLFERLHAEPVVLSPHSRRSNKASYFAMTAVASIMAMAFLAWLSVQIEREPAYQQARKTVNTVRTVSLPVNEAVNDYLMAHQEVSPSSDVQGAASYIRAVAYRQPGAGK